MNPSSSPSPAVAALHRFWAAEERYIASGGEDFALIAETLDPEIVLHQAESLPYGGDWRGYDGFEAWLNRMGEAWSSVEAQDQRFIEQGDTVVVLLTMKAKAKKGNQFFTTPVCQVVKVGDERILEWWIYYWDTVAVNSFLGHDQRSHSSDQQ